MTDLPPPGSRGGKDDISEPLQLQKHKNTKQRVLMQQKLFYQQVQDLEAIKNVKEQ